VLTGATVRMVENVDPNEARAQQSRPASSTTTSQQQGQGQQQGPDSLRQPRRLWDAVPVAF